MKLISWNVNGIRAVERKEALQELIDQHSPDILFIQETKAHKEQLSPYLTESEEYHQFYHSAEKKGYSGVAIWAKKSLFPEEYINIGTSMSDFEDIEGRIISLECEDSIFLGGYFPNGGKSQEAWNDKIVFYNLFLKHINHLRSLGKSVIWCGDLNVAHNEIDLARPKNNEGKVGFHPKEREWLDVCIKDKWVDTFRTLHPKEVSYTWWDMPTRARERNVGWRIDYFFVDEALLDTVKKSFHLSDHLGSDHCPIILELN